jgi:predicted  nucleic acid-binding Zn-ribbon protein
VRILRTIPVVLFSAVIVAGCNTETKQQLATVSHVDSLRTDSLATVRKDLLEEVMASTRFVTAINNELMKARVLDAKQSAKLETTSEITATNEQRKLIVGRITHLVARLDSVQSRLASTRSRVQQMAKQDSGLVVQIAAYEKSVADLQEAAARERTQFQGTINQQTTQIASLNSRVDTLTSKVDTLTTVRTALVDTVHHLTAEKNTAYYVVGTQEELIKKGVLVAEGGKRFLIVGGRHVVPARQLDPSNFSRIDRLTDRTIPLPEGEYQILTRQNVSFAKAQAEKDGKIAGALTIEQPESFWETSRFLIIVRS